MAATAPNITPAITIEEFSKQHKLFFNFDKIQKEKHDKYRNTITNIINGKIDKTYLEDINLSTYIGLYYEHILKDKIMAEKYYLQQIEKGNNKPLYRLGKLYESQNKIDLAIKYYKLAIEKDNSKAANSLGRIYYAQNKMELAKNCYHIAIKNNNTNALNNLGFLYCKQEKYDLAEECYKTAIKENNIYAMHNLAHMYKIQEKKELAAEYYFLAIKNGIDSTKEIKKLLTDLKLYNMLYKSKIQNKIITKLMTDLRKNKTVHNFANKLLFNNKVDECIICKDEKSVVPLDCAHFYCSDCYAHIYPVCAVCRN